MSKTQSKKAPVAKKKKVLNKKGGDPSNLIPGGPRGKRGPNKATLIQRELHRAFMENVEKDFHPLINQCIRMAKKGDKTMLKYLLDKTIPNAVLEDDSESKGKGGNKIVINVGSLQENKGVIDAEIVEDGDVDDTE